MMLLELILRIIVNRLQDLPLFFQAKGGHQLRA